MAIITKVINIEIANAKISGKFSTVSAPDTLEIGPKVFNVPMFSTHQFLIRWFVNMSIIEEIALAPDAVPIRYSRIMFHPMMKAINSPTVTFQVVLEKCHAKSHQSKKWQLLTLKSQKRALN